MRWLETKVYIKLKGKIMQWCKYHEVFLVYHLQECVTNAFLNGGSNFATLYNKWCMTLSMFIW
jgi:hypothetical protein